ncbi:hypothetical protein [Nocardia araoensis]|uniref:hypothetical protein n=1 Tax=Nocardia araoensis TaxID=228600 RepID=UPI0012F62DAC|nr:hypothetical protein [Nocardia araoensis]
MGNVLLHGRGGAAHDRGDVVDDGFGERDDCDSAVIEFFCGDAAGAGCLQKRCGGNGDAAILSEVRPDQCLKEDAGAGSSGCGRVDDEAGCRTAGVGQAAWRA